MRLFIAEKPSVARAVAAGLGKAKNSDGCIVCGDSTVTWCFGHMFEQAEPDVYTDADAPTKPDGRKRWRWEDLPIVPQKWILNPKPDAKKQLKVIKDLLKKADEVVNCGDPDREGQLLVDEVLEEFGNKKPVKRYWCCAQDATSVQRALKDLRDNENYAGMREAARARSRADWLVGMNLTRGYTLRAGALVSVGRVQTPTLKLVCDRDAAIENFKPSPYFQVIAQVASCGGNFKAALKIDDSMPGVDSEGRLADEAQAAKICAACSGKKGKISSFKKESKKQNPPLCLSLSDMQSKASAKWGYGADEVLALCQSLYEKKLLTYPRTDCGYLPTAQKADAPKVFAAIRSAAPNLASAVAGADAKADSRVWDDSKTTAHHGIVPTMDGSAASSMTDKERNIYGLAAQHYLANFYPPMEYEAASAEIGCEGYVFKASGRVVTKPGWKAMLSDDEEQGKEKDETENQSLPPLSQGADADFGQCEAKKSMTKAPSRFTEGSLIKAMESIHKFIDDPDAKKRLKEGDGIGTSATRAAIITELKRKEFLKNSGKSIVSTPKGRSACASISERFKSPVLTAMFEGVLKEVEAGKTKADAFIAAQVKAIEAELAALKSRNIEIAGAKKKESPAVSQKHLCKKCGKGLIRRESQKKKGSFWWGCSGWPQCDMAYLDKNGEPDFSTGKK